MGLGVTRRQAEQALRSVFYSLYFSLCRLLYFCSITQKSVKILLNVWLSPLYVIPKEVWVWICLLCSIVVCMSATVFRTGRHRAWFIGLCVWYMPKVLSEVYHGICCYQCSFFYNDVIETTQTTGQHLLLVESCVFGWSLKKRHRTLSPNLVLSVTVTDKQCSSWAVYQGGCIQSVLIME